ncbi:hypothetical protein C0W44_14745 [Photobacterium leiognathi subsp. mandapamensis]|nr:hypothetical protein C0W44_14745 [Photobacterium leiognathi subsp. mandapamensis]
MLRFFAMCDPKKCFASWIAALAVRVEPQPFRHLLRSLARNSGAFSFLAGNHSALIEKPHWKQ